MNKEQKQIFIATLALVVLVLAVSAMAGHYLVWYGTGTAVLFAAILWAIWAVILEPSIIKRIERKIKPSIKSQKQPTISYDKEFQGFLLEFEENAHFLDRKASLDIADYIFDNLAKTAADLPAKP